MSSAAVAVAVDEVGGEADTLNNLERLILAQAVYELGSNAWTSVSSILSQHPLISKRDDATFSPLACQKIYYHLLTAAGLDSAEREKQPRNAHSNNLKLAQRMYQARVLELKQLILAEEVRFKFVIVVETLFPLLAYCLISSSVAAEIEAIRAGKWDVKIEEDLGVDESSSDRLALSPKSERVSAIEGSGSDLTGVSDTSSSAPQVQADPPFPDEEMVQRQLDEDLAIPDSLPRANTPPSTVEGEVERPIAQELSPVPSHVGTDFVDEHIDPESPQLRHESPDPLDIITPAEDEGEPFSTHKRADAVQPSSSPTQPLESPDSAVSAESEQSNVTEPPEIAEVDGARGSLEHLMPSEVVERSETEVDIESDVPAAVSISDPAEGEISADDRSAIVQKDDTSIRSLSGPPIVHAVRSPSPLEGATISAACTAKTSPFVTEPNASGLLEVKEDMQLDENLPEETFVKQEDEMEIEQDGHEAASPVAESSRHDHKRKVSEAASIFSDSARDKKRTREDSQPVDEDESSPVRRRGRPPATDSQTSKKFQTVIIMVHSQISQHRNGNIFHNPIKTSEAPDYYDIVRRPMDLKTIKARIREGQIASSDEFQRDVYLMFANSLMYNRPGSDIYNMAEEMMLESEAQINTFRQTEGIIKGSHR
ncbi:hypothetical protein BC827DRAFT_1181226 [Russula dissimulans]|nr:hypothetical protein BC827DRAFT_1181226 [Russula dissimulans]